MKTLQLKLKQAVRARRILGRALLHMRHTNTLAIVAYPRDWQARIETIQILCDADSSVLTEWINTRAAIENKKEAERRRKFDARVAEVLA